MLGGILGIYKLVILNRALPIGSHPSSFDLFTTPPSHLAMSIIRSIPNSRAVFATQNKHKKITRVDNTCHAHSHIDPAVAYPTLYEVRHWLWQWFSHNLMSGLDFPAYASWGDLSGSAVLGCCQGGSLEAGLYA